jgi:hypothetical protein
LIGQPFQKVRVDIFEKIPYPGFHPGLKIANPSTSSGFKNNLFKINTQSLSRDGSKKAQQEMSEM